MPLALLAALLATAPAGAVPNPFACVATATEAELHIEAGGAHLDLAVRGGEAWLQGARQPCLSAECPVPSAPCPPFERLRLVEAAGRAALARDPQVHADGLPERALEVTIAWRCGEERGSLRRVGGFLTGLPVADPATLALGPAGATGPGGWRHRPDHSSARNLADLVEATVLAHRLDQ